MFVMRKLINKENFGSGFLKPKLNRKAQEELVGFGIIVAIVMIILMIFMVFYFNRPRDNFYNSQEVSSFLEALLQTKTNCEDLFEFKSVQDVIIMCERNERCLQGEDACEIMEEYILEIIKRGFRVEQGYVKGYLLKIYGREGILFEDVFGNKSFDIKSSNKEIIRINGEINLEIFN